MKVLCVLELLDYSTIRPKGLKSVRKQNCFSLLKKEEKPWC